MKKELERFETTGYGDYICSCCQTKELIGVNFTVGECDDEEGYEWRQFCTDCEQKVKSLTNEQIYEKFPPSPVV